MDTLRLPRMPHPLKLYLNTHIERQNLHRRVEEFVSWMFDVSAPEEKPERKRER